MANVSTLHNVGTNRTMNLTVSELLDWGFSAPEIVAIMLIKASPKHAPRETPEKRILNDIRKTK